MYSSPSLFDVDNDGVREIIVADYNGKIEFIKDNVSICFSLLILRVKMLM